MKECPRVKPKYYHTCYNSLLFPWQGSWSEGDFITLQVIASYIKLGLPQFLGSTSVWLTVKLTAFHHRVIRLACCLCIKQEQTELLLSWGCRLWRGRWYGDEGAQVCSAERNQPSVTFYYPILCHCCAPTSDDSWIYFPLIEKKKEDTLRGWRELKGGIQVPSSSSRFIYLLTLF